VKLSHCKLRSRFAYVAVSACLCIGICNSASADDDDGGGQWNPRFTRFTTLQFGLTAVGVGGFFAADPLLGSSDDVNWRGNILFDSGARSFFASSSESGRRRAADISDVLGLSLMLYPFAVDALLVAGGMHGNYEVTFQLAMIGLQSFLAVNMVTSLTKRLVGRARPDMGNCVSGEEMACATENESFVSGHTSAAFTGAGLMCANQQNLQLYGSGVAGAIACGAGLVAAGTVGTLRMVADRHHMSDVLAGAALGFAAGYLLPNLTNFDFGQSGRSRGTLMPLAGDGTAGLQYLQLF
jgi:membrane-associated phospholipid phosphatase